MVNLNNKKQNIIQLIKLLKQMKSNPLLNSYKRSSNIFIRRSLPRQQIERLQQQKMAIRNYHINMFIKNKQIEMAEIRDLYMNGNNSLKIEEPAKIECQEGQEEQIQIEEKDNPEIEQEQEQEKENITINPKNNPKSNSKILVILAIHADKLLRLKSINSIMYFLNQVDNIDIVIVNSKKTTSSEHIQNTFKKK